MSSQLAKAMLALLRAEGVDIKRVAADSRHIQAGDVFLAYPGHHSDGRHFIAEAIANGAAAVLWEREGFEWNSAWQVPHVPVDQLRWMAGDIADEVFGHPTEKLWVVGVTGTNGKTSVSQWLSRAYNELGRRCAVIGTLGMGFPGRLDPSANTTPDAIVLQEQLASFVAAGAEAVTLEVSSIGLDQGRLNGSRIDLAIFTNLTRDHLDYHHSMEAYAEAKTRLFDLPDLRSVVLNFDDLMGMSLARRLQEREIEVIGYTVIPDNAAAAPAHRMIVAEQLRTTQNGLRFTVCCEGERHEMAVGLVGQFNVSNLLAVIAALVQSGYSLADAVAVSRDLTPPEGRMQTLGGVGEPLVVIDYAHTPNALEQALLALRPTVTSRNGRLVVMFGCGGDRDPGKRAMMGEVAQRLADRIIITSDNPRSEDPQTIVTAIAEGAPDAEQVLDRASAIRHAVRDALADDVVLIAGKGHEAYQEVGRERLHFSDAEQARGALVQWNREQESEK